MSPAVSAQAAEPVEAGAEGVFGELREQCGRIFVAGLSMGACLALRLAAARGDDVSGVVVVNPSLAPDTKLFLLAPLLKHVVLSLRGVAGDIKKKDARAVGYPRIPVGAAATLPEMWRATAAMLPGVKQPLLIYRSTVDHVVGPASMKVLTAALPDAEVRSLADSFHDATLDSDAPVIFDGPLKFIKEHGYKD